MDNFRSCFICGGDIKINKIKIGNSKSPKRFSDSADGVYICKRWVCCHCYELNFKEFFEDLPLLNENESLNSSCI